MAKRIHEDVRFTPVGCLVITIAAVASWIALTSATASAASIYQRSSGCNPAPCDDSDLVYAGANGVGESNNVQVTQSGGTYRFREMAPGTTITSFYSICSRVSSTEVTCPTTWQYPDELATFDVDAELHDGFDQIDMRTTRPARIEGGAGSDVLKGGSAGDTILGDSDFVTPAGPDGADFIDGRGGADFMRGDGAQDTVSYASRSTAVNVSLDGVANDGGFGEGDNAASDFEILRATSAGDTLTGNNSANQIFGGEGFDAISGLGGSDELHGGVTNDNLDGGNGNDSIFGEEGSDTISGGANDDQMDGGADDDRFTGGAGADNMVGAAGTDSTDYTTSTAPLSVTADDQSNDGASGEGDNVHSDIEVLHGGQANDILVPNIDFGEVWGGPGNDILFGAGQVGNDRLEGGDGNDTLDGRWGADLMNGGGGVDTVDYSDHYFDDGEGNLFGAASVPDGVDNDGNGWIDSGAGGSGPSRSHDNVGSDIENVIGSGGADHLVGTVDPNRLQGGGSNDTLIGDAANDVLLGGDADDDLNGDAGNDNLDGGRGADDMDGGADVDMATYASRTADLLVTIDNNANDGETALNERDNVRQTIENVRGGAGADVLRGSSAVNELIGGGRNDTLNGRLGADTLNGQDGVDTITYADRNAAVAVTLDEKRNDGADPNGDGTSTAAEEGDVERNIENADGGSGNDILRALIGNAVANLLRGFGGDDTLNALDGTATVDTVDCGGGAADRFAKDASDAQAGCEIALP